jgi:hypothetical protein
MEPVDALTVVTWAVGLSETLLASSAVSGLPVAASTIERMAEMLG